MVLVISGMTGRAVARLFENPLMPGIDPGADAAVQGMVRPVGEDSVEVVFQLTNGRGTRSAKTIRHATTRDQAGTLPGVVTPMVTAWIESLEKESRPTRAAILSRTSLDSMLRAAQRFRESTRRRPMPRPDSPPPAPIPPLR
jgi:hypothetical protein